MTAYVNDGTIECLVEIMTHTCTCGGKTWAMPSYGDPKSITVYHQDNGVVWVGLKINLDALYPDSSFGIDRYRQKMETWHQYLGVPLVQSRN